VDDFSSQLYQKAAAKLFAGIDKGEANPAAIISLFTDEEEQREVASLFNTRLGSLETKTEREKAINDIVRTVKKNSYANITSRLGNDVKAISEALEGRKLLDELLKTNIKL